MAITPLPTPPSRNDPANFPERGDAFLAALPAFASEANALAADVAEKQSIASAAATTATTKAGEANDSATAAGSAKTAAESASSTAAGHRSAAETAQNQAQAYAETAVDAAASATAAAATFAPGPAFSATTASGQTVSNGVHTKCALANEVFDTDGAYNQATSRFQPQVDGYYQVNVVVSGSSSTTTGRVVGSIYKNGVLYRSGSTAPQGNANVGHASVGDLVYLNGTTDYIEAYGNVEGTGALMMNAASGHGFSAYLARRS